MKFVVSSAEMLRMLSQVAGIIPSKAHLPAIQYLNMRMEDADLILTTTDIEIWMQTRGEVEVLDESEFNVSVPHKEILDTLKNIPEQPVSFEWKAEEGNLVIKTSNGLYSIGAFPLEKMMFPALPLLDEESRIIFPLAVLTRAIQKTLFAASTDDLKPAMNGLFFHLTPEKINIVSTDAHRLSRYTRHDMTFEKEVSFIMPHKGLKHFLSVGAQFKDADVELKFDAYNAFLQIEDTLLICRLIDGRFPDYKTVIPQGNPNKAVIVKKELVDSMKRLDIFSNKVTHLGVFQFVGNLLKMESKDLNTQNKATEDIKSLYEGEELSIGFNLALMRDVIKNIDTEDVIVEMDTPSRPAIILPSENETGEELLMLLMPVMLGVGY